MDLNDFGDILMNSILSMTANTVSCVISFDCGYIVGY